MSTEKIRELSSPLTVRAAAPGPWMSIASSIGMSPVVSVIVPVRPGAKVTVSAPAARFACSIASRRLPAPASLRFETWKVAASAEGATIAAAPTAATVPAAARLARRRMLR